MQSDSTASPGEIVDTNVLIYAHDPADPRKQALAIGLLEDLVLRGRLALTAQILNEFYARATRPNKPPALTHSQALAIVEDLIRVANVLPLTGHTTLQALEGVSDQGLSFWDAPDLGRGQREWCNCSSHRRLAWPHRDRGSDL